MKQAGGTLLCDEAPSFQDDGANESPSRINQRPCELDQIVAELRAIRRPGLERILAAGQLIFERFFGASIEEWRNRKPSKEHSLRRLAERRGCPMSKSAMHQAVSVYVAFQSLKNVAGARSLGANHIAAVLGANESERERLLCLTSEHGWSVRRLREEVARSSVGKAERRGRPRHGPAGQAASHLRTCTRLLLELAEQLRGAEVPDHRWAELDLCLGDFMDACDRAAEVLSASGGRGRPSSIRMLKAAPPTNVDGERSSA